jgi:hypothetical protein
MRYCRLEDGFAFKVRHRSVLFGMITEHLMQWGKQTGQLQGCPTGRREYQG